MEDIPCYKKFLSIKTEEELRQLGIAMNLKNPNENKKYRSPSEYE